MTLFIQSALSFLEICIFDSKKIYEYKKCKPKSLNLEISKFLIRNKKLKINKIIISNGPGWFTSLRIGMNYAKTISFIKKIPIYSFDTNDYLMYIYNNTYEKNSTKKPVFIHQANLSEVFYNGKLLNFSKISKEEELDYFGEIQTKHKMPKNYNNIEFKDVSSNTNLFKNIISITEKHDFLKKMKYKKEAYKL